MKDAKLNELAKKAFESAINEDARRDEGRDL